MQKKKAQICLGPQTISSSLPVAILPNGSLTGDGTWTYGYDIDNRLTSASKAGTAITYSYDMRGRRVRKTVNGVSTGWMLDGDDEVAEFDTDGSLKLRYIPGPAIDQPIAMVTYGTNIHTYPHTDRQGSTISASDDTAARIEGPYTYDAYGNGAPTTGFPFKYTGRRLDPETGLYFYRARYYSSALGRFLQTDPVGYGPDLNWYAYVGNDPVNGIDPTGLAKVCTSGTGSRIPTCVP